MKEDDVTEILDTITNVITAPDGFKKKHGSLTVLPGKVSVFVNGMIIVDTRLGEIVLKLKDGLHLEPGTRVTLRPDSTGKSVKLSTQKTKLPTPKAPMQKAHAVDNVSDQQVRAVAPRPYRPEVKPIDTVHGHSTAANAVADTVLRAPTKADTFNLARAIALLPDTRANIPAISAATFLLVCLSRGGLKAWAGTSTENLNEIWDNVMREITLTVPGMGDWKVRQFPIQTSSAQKWALFALADSTNSAVSRFIIELPTESYGIIQLKGFGSTTNCELIVSSSTSIPTEVVDSITDLVQRVAEDIDAELKLSFTTDPTSVINLSQARRTSFGI